MKLLTAAATVCWMVLGAAFDPPTKADDATADPVVHELKMAPIGAILPSGEEVQLARGVTPASAEAGAATSIPAEPVLEAAASLPPLIGLFGMMALGGALALPISARRLRWKACRRPVGQSATRAAPFNEE